MNFYTSRGWRWGRWLHSEKKKVPTTSTTVKSVDKYVSHFAVNLDKYKYTFIHTHTNKCRCWLRRMRKGPQVVLLLSLVCGSYPDSLPLRWKVVWFHSALKGPHKDLDYHLANNMLSWCTWEYFSFHLALSPLALFTPKYRNHRARSQD